MLSIFISFFLYALSPTSSTLELSSFVKKGFPPLHSYQSLEIIKNSIDDIPLYLSQSFFRYAIPFDFRQQLPLILNQAQKGCRRSCLCVLAFFYSCEGLAEDFQRLLCSDVDFIHTIRNYSCANDFIEDGHKSFPYKINGDFFENIFFQFFNNEKMFTDTGLDQIVRKFDFPSNCLTSKDFALFYLITMIGHKKLSYFQKKLLIQYIQTEGLNSRILSYLLYYDSFVEQSEVFYNFVKESMKEQPYNVRSIPEGHRFYQKLLLEIPLCYFDLSSIMNHYVEQGFSSPVLPFMRAILEDNYLDTDTDVFSVLLKNRPPSLSLLTSCFPSCLVVPNIIPFVMTSQNSFLLFNCFENFLNQLPLSLESTKPIFVSLRNLWKKILPRSVEPQNLLNYLKQQKGKEEVEVSSVVFSYFPFSLTSKVIDQASNDLIAQYTDSFIQEVVQLFPITKQSNFHDSLFNFLSLHQEKDFQLETNLPFNLCQLSRLSLLGRTVYGYDSTIERWVAYKFLKVGENKEELIKGEVLHQFLLQTGEDFLSQQLPLGLFETKGLPQNFFVSLFPGQEDVLKLFQFNETGEIFYRKYAVKSSQIFHYTYEEDYSFLESSEGIHRSLKEACFFWLHHAYFYSVASFFHNSLSNGRRYFTGIMFYRGRFLGKLNNWNTISTNHSDFRLSGLADKEDVVPGLTKEIDEALSRSTVHYNRQIFDKENAFALTILTDYLLLADLLTFRKYISVLESKLTQLEKDTLKCELIDSIKKNYLTVWCSLTGDSEKQAMNILYDQSLFPWDEYIKQFCSISFPDKNKTNQLLMEVKFMYQLGLTPSGHYKESVSSEGINLGAYNGDYPVTCFTQIVKRFIIFLFKHRSKYLQQVQKTDLTLNHSSRFNLLTVLSSS